jgi:hypothetical protein
MAREFESLKGQSNGIVIRFREASLGRSGNAPENPRRFRQNR